MKLAKYMVEPYNTNRPNKISNTDRVAYLLEREELMLPRDPFFQELLMFQQWITETAVQGGHTTTPLWFGVGLFCRCYDTNGRLVGYGLELEFGAELSPVSGVHIASGEGQFTVDIDRRIERNRSTDFSAEVQAGRTSSVISSDHRACLGVPERRFQKCPRCPHAHQ